MDDENKSEKTQYGFQPVLVLPNIYFLDQYNTKFILIGYSATNNFNPIIIFAHNLSFVELTLSDWMALTMNDKVADNWFKTIDSVEGKLIKTKNIKVVKKIEKNNPTLQIQKLAPSRSNNYINLNMFEYRKLVEIDSFVQTIMKNLNSNWIQVQDYYNLYVFYCNLKNKTVLDDSDFFTYDDSNFDCLRLFNEISINCRQKLLYDITIFD